MIGADPRPPDSFPGTLADLDVVQAGFETAGRADDAEAMYREGKHLYGTIGMPNVMIKIPATKAGYEAMRDLLKKGISVNATLVFSPEQTVKCIEAIKEGIAGFRRYFPKANLPKTVISIFVSRFDRLLDEKMAAAGLPTGKIGIMNAAKCYNIIAKENLNYVKPLFASTGVKGDDLPKDYYVSELMYPGCVNTAPLETIEAFISGDQKSKTPPSDAQIEEFFARVADAKIDMKKAYKKLLDDGLAAFEEAFKEIIKTLKKEK